MDETTCVTLLEQHGIKPTSNRIVVLKALANSENPSSIADLERSILTIDKSGIFRSLTLFRDHHLVHALEDGEGGLKYELCHSHDDEEDDDQHVHFYCERCHRMFCLYDTPVPAIDLPEGYIRQSSNYLVKGICPECKARKEG
ncbi:MAG: transcriptional repressor [Prevotella sp.]|nr:transcriptional repressor [Prevotella sp.]